MPFDAIQFFKDNGIQHDEQHHHSTRGWVQINCPFCNSGDFHMGFNLNKNTFNCWQCGSKRTLDVIEELLRCTRRESRSTFKQYSTGRGTRRTEHVKMKAPVLRRRIKSLPVGTKPMTKRHKRYLEGRDYDPDALEETWELQGTGPVGPYKLRVIIPIYYHGELATYQGRDITNRAKARYKACPKELEARSIKDCLYGLDLATGDSVAICEGVADVWRLGPGAVATFGMDVSKAQFRLLSHFKQRYLILDPGRTEKAVGDKLGAMLDAWGPGSTRIVELNRGMDPGDLPQKDADWLMSKVRSNG